MSMLGMSFLNEIVTKSRFDNANEILNRLRKKVKTSLRQTGESHEPKDGMDIALCIIDLEYMQLQYAGAYNPLYLIRRNSDNEPELTQIKADRQPVSHYLREKDFTNHDIEIQKGDTFYIFTDGYFDQMGGENHQKFMAKRFRPLILEIQDKSMETQKEILDKTLEDWKNKTEQIDDILIIGFRF